MYEAKPTSKKTTPQNQLRYRVCLNWWDWQVLPENKKFRVILGNATKRYSSENWRLKGKILKYTLTTFIKVPIRNFLLTKKIQLN